MLLYKNVLIFNVQKNLNFIWGFLLIKKCFPQLQHYVNELVIGWIQLDKVSCYPNLLLYWQISRGSVRIYGWRLGKRHAFRTVKPTLLPTRLLRPAFLEREITNYMAPLWEKVMASGSPAWLLMNVVHFTLGVKNQQSF